jgi:nucleotide-binding universal stress UspA family protein
MIKKILVPVDFSDTAANAVRYAVALSKTLVSSVVKVAHVFMPQVDSEFPNFVPPMEEFTRFRQKMLDDFVGEIEELKQASGATIEHEIWIGFPADELIKHSAEYDLIVMGTTGEGGLLNKVFGSVSSAVAQRAECPVLLIPSGTGYSRVNRVLYASHYEAADRDMVDQLLAFNNELFRACIHFVHVRDEQSETFEQAKVQIFEKLFQDGEPSFAFEIAELEGESVTEALNEYADANKIELIVLATRRRNFWQQLFHKSQTKSLAQASSRPLLVLHLT